MAIPMKWAKDTKFVHWLGGAQVTPACGAWAFAAGIRTDFNGAMVKDRTIGCPKCLSMLKKSPADWRVYRDRKKIIRAQRAAIAGSIRASIDFLQREKRRIPISLIGPIDRKIEDMKAELKTVGEP